MATSDYFSIPTNLAPRFQIRKLEEKHVEWACAIVCHSNIFHSPIWTVIYTEDRVDLLYSCWEPVLYTIVHQIQSGHSFGVFDTEYKFENPESAKTGGKLYWDAKNPSKDNSGAEMLSQMDFPLCSVAMSYDGIKPLDPEKLKKLSEAMPAFSYHVHDLEARDKRKPESRKSTAPNQILFQNATSTRHDYEGNRIMKELAHFVMQYADSQEFRGIEISTSNERVSWVWLHPPAPYQAELIGESKSWDAEEEEEIDGKKTGRKFNPHKDVRLIFAKIYVHLKREDKLLENDQNE